MLVRLSAAARMVCSCGAVMFALGCSANWIAGDPPEVPHGAYLEDEKTTPAIPPEETVQDEFPPLPLEGAGLPDESKLPDESTPQIPDITYTVQKNDTLGGIALVYGVPVQTLAEYNNLSVNGILPAGKKLQIPSAKIDSAKARPAAQVKYTPPAPLDGPEKTTPAGGRTVHTVQAGDMLSKLAVQYHVTAGAIAKANGIKMNSVLHIGQKLVIPPPGKSAAGVKSAPAKRPAKKSAKASAKKPAKASAKPKTSADSELDSMLDTPGDQPEKTSPPDAPEEAPASASAADAPETYIYAIRNEISLDELAGVMEYRAETLRALNPGIDPAEKLPAGSRIVLPLLPE